MRVPSVRVLAVAFAMVLVASAMPQGQAASDPTVYVTKTGAKYHRDGCSSLSRSRIPRKLSEAAAAYGACLNCRPPIPKAVGAIGSHVPREIPKARSAPVTDGRCQATTKKGAQCKRKAKAGGAYCWQHG